MEILGDISGNNRNEDACFNDLICALKEENNKLRAENQRLKSIVDTVPCIIHDTNNFLTPIVNSVEIIKKEIKNKDTILKNLDIINKCAGDCVNLEERLMNRLRGDNTHRKEIFSLNSVINDVLDIIYKKYPFDKYKVEFRTEMDSDVLIKANSTEIKEIFVNLFSNSVDAIKGNGHVYISTKKLKDIVKIQIKDDGSGMDEDTLSKIFNPYFSTKGENGLGVGLNICEGIINSYGGTMTCESRLHEGTSFIIQFPYCEEKDCSFHGRVLIIDDEKQIRDIISDMIRTIINCDVKAVSAKEAEVEACERVYDVIISDYLMPEINGVELARLIKCKQPNVYFCLMTGLLEDFNNKIYNDIDKVIYKPINLNQIRQLFNSVHELKR